MASRGLNLLARCFSGLSGFMLAFGVAFMCVEVFTRFILGWAHDWAMSLIVGACVASYMLAAGPDLRNDAHIRVDVLIIQLKGRQRQIAETILALVNLLVLIFMLISSIYIFQSVVKYKLEDATTLHSPMWILYLSLPVGVAGCVIFAAEKFVRHVHTLRTKTYSKTNEIDINALTEG